MMRAKVKDWFSRDVPEVWKWRPQSLDEICYYLEMTIGMEHSRGGDLFGVMVVSPQANRARRRARPSNSRSRRSGERHHLFVTEYSWQVVLDHVNKVLDICEGETWPEVAGKLSRYFYWEYEDYRE